MQTLLPTRALSFEDSTEEGFKVRLQKTRGLRGWGEGGSPTAATTSTSYNDMIADIPWLDIPRTFQHVTEFVHMFAIQYL